MASSHPGTESTDLLAVRLRVLLASILWGVRRPHVLFLVADGAGANVDDTPKNFRAQNGDALEAQQLASTSDMLQGRVSPANSDGEDDELDELMDEFGFPLLRRGRRCRRLQSSLEQAARSMSSGVSIGSRDTGGTSGSSGSSTGRRRVFSGQSNFEFDRAMERAQRSSSILLQPLFHFELNMEQFDDLTGQGCVSSDTVGGARSHMRHL